MTTYCGRFIRHGDWRSDKVIRLFHRSSGQFSDDIVHETFKITQKGSIGTLTSPLLHYSYSSLEDVLNKVNEYSSATAERKYRQGQKSSLSKALIHAFWSFIRGYILRGGFLDGREGFLLAISNAEGVFYRYVKIIYRNKHSQ
jgi:hypothetical protein